MNAALVISASAGVALWLMQRQITNEATNNSDEGFFTDLQDAAGTLEGYFMNADDFTFDANVRAFLMLIRYGESSLSQSAYTTLYGGGQFADLSDHPRQYFTVADGRRTSAAGAYQIVASTWDDLQRSGANLIDFSPPEQDRAAVMLIKRRGALSDVTAGRFDAAIRKCRNEWTSLPGARESRYTMATANGLLASYGANFAEGATA